MQKRDEKESEGIEIKENQDKKDKNPKTKNVESNNKQKTSKEEFISYDDTADNLKK
jgi:hypothetical protein